MTPQPNLPDPIAAGRLIAEMNQWQAMAFVLLFVVVAFMMLTIWLVVMIARKNTEVVEAIKTFDGVREALFALRLTLERDRAVEREEWARAKAERRVAGRERKLAQGERDEASQDRETRS